MRISAGTDLLPFDFAQCRFGQSQNLMTVLLLVLTTRDVNPEVLVVAGLDDGLIEVRLVGQELKPTVEDVLVGMGFVILPIGVSRFGDLDVSCLTQSVLAGVCATYLNVEGIASVATSNDDRLVGECSEGFETLFAELLQGWNEL